MSNLIVQNDVPGFKVYGQQQVDYTVDGVAHQDYATAVAQAALRRAVGVEDATVALSAAIRARQAKITDLSNALAVMNRIAAGFKKDDKTTTWSSWSAELAAIAATLQRYGVENKISLNGSQGRIQKSDLSIQQQLVENAVDNEDNDIQQEMIALQSGVNKRDEGYNTAYTLVRRALRAEQTTIANIGR